MKKLICAILICLMLPFASIITTGCNDKNYNLKEFYTTYQNIGNNATNLTITEANKVYQFDTNIYKIDIDYSMSSKLSSLVEDSSSKYHYLKYFYQQLLDNSLAPMYAFGEQISTSKKVSDKQTEQLFKNLNILKQEYDDIDFYVGILTNSLKSTDNEAINLSHLKKVFLQYEQAINAANNLSNVVCEVYFSTVLSNSNYDYSSKNYNQLTETDLAQIAINTRTRIYYYKSLYANIYNQLYVRENNLKELIISSSSISLPTYAPYSYIKNISNLTAKSSQTLLGYQETIYNNAISLYNIQRNFETAYKHFNTATSKVAYSSLNTLSTIDELNYGAIINQFANGIAIDSYEILNNLINLLYF